MTDDIFPFFAVFFKLGGEWIRRVLHTVNRVESINEMHVSSPKQTCEQARRKHVLIKVMNLFIGKNIRKVLLQRENDLSNIVISKCTIFSYMKHYNTRHCFA
jgi:hypothetical protein